MWFDITRKKYLSIVILFATLFSSIAMAGPAKDLFLEGIEASKNKKYDEALTFFLQSRDLGYNSGALHYNIGVTYYQLKRYDRAYASFSLLVEHPSLAGPAVYNLGLVARKQKLRQEAILWFEKAFELSKDQNIHILSKKALNSLGVHVDVKSGKYKVGGKSWKGLISFTYATNDNVNSSNDVLDSVERKIDSSSNRAYISTSKYLWGNYLNGMQFSGSFDDTQYNKAAEYDFRALGVKLAYNYKSGGWSSGIATSYSESEYGGKDYQSINKHELKTFRRLNSSFNIRFRLNYSDISVDKENSGFAYLEGTKSQFIADIYYFAGRNKITTSYIAEVNYRDGIPQNKVVNAATVPIVNASPIRQSLKIKWRTPLSKRIFGIVSARYRYSKYQGDNRELDLQSNLQDDFRRIDHRSGYTAEIEYKAKKKFGIVLGFSYSENDSNRPNDESSYSKNKVYSSIRVIY